ncbi:rCG41513 [Rattus norvegicus]|uniref:RCG41513 n=1 Tax=Rattus norvegicus TaxID=10116 RepID=A6IHN3_RAT|nr:rCG41513 [Rattus norvegicus]
MIDRHTDRHDIYR